MLLLSFAVPFAFKEAACGKTIFLVEICDSVKGLIVAEPQEDESCPCPKLGSDFRPLSLLCPLLMQHSLCNPTDLWAVGDTGCFRLPPVLISCITVFWVFLCKDELWPIIVPFFDDATSLLGARFKVLLFIISKCELSWHFRPRLGCAVLGWNINRKLIRVNHVKHTLNP